MRQEVVEERVLVYETGGGRRGGEGEGESVCEVGGCGGGGDRV